MESRERVRGPAAVGHGDVDPSAIVHRGDLVRSEFDLIAAIDRAVGSVIADAAASNIELAVKIGATVPATYDGDRAGIQHVLDKLVRNAIEFTQNGHVLVTVEHDCQSSPTLPLVIAVEDTGIGIPTEIAQAVFATDAPQGTGTGLPFARQLVERMGGRLCMTSQAGSGSVLSVHLPCDEGGHPAVGRRPLARLNGADVLVISPRAVIRRLLHEELREWGVHVALALTLDEGHEIVEEAAEDDEAIQLIIIDQDETRIGDIPTVVLGDPTRALPDEQIARAGYAAYIRKPLRADRLAVVLDRVLLAIENGKPVVGLLEADFFSPVNEQGGGRSRADPRGSGRNSARATD